MFPNLMVILEVVYINKHLFDTRIGEETNQKSSEHYNIFDGHMVIY